MMLTLLRKTMLVLLTMAIMLAGFGPAAIQATPTAYADVKSGYWAKWTAQIDFRNNLVNARWTIFLGRYADNGEPVIEKQKTQPLECIPVGNLIIKDEEAIFDGTSHLECAIPNFYNALTQLLDGKPMPFSPKHFNGEFCQCKNPLPWVAADVVVTSDITSPILYQIDNNMQFYTTPDDGEGASHLLLEKGAALPQQLSWPIDVEKGNQLWSGGGMPLFLAMTKDSAWWYDFLSPKFYDMAQTLSSDHYFHWANTEPEGLVFDHSTDFKMTNQATTFLVGYDNTTHFTGKLRKLAWDPPCVPSD
jgi:hypothetical protein